MKYANDHDRPMRLVVPAAQSSVEAVGDHVLIYHVAAKNSPVADTRYRLLWPWGQSGAEIRRILRAEKPDLVETSDKYTLPLLSGFLRKSWVQDVPRAILAGTSHERLDDTAKAYFPLPWMWDLLTRVFMKQLYFPMFDWHVANSEYTAEELIPASKGHRLHREMRVLPMGVDAQGLRPSLRTPEARCRLAQMANVGCEAKLLLYVGRLATEKNLPLLVETLKRLPSEYTLIAAGDGALKPWLETKGVRLLGHVTRDDVPRLYSGADAFLHANPREPFGIAPLEAMAAGVPLVAPNRGGVLSYASNSNAWLADPEPESFAEAIRQIFEDESAARAKLAAARATAIEHDWPKIAGRYFKLYDEMVETGERWRN